MKTGIQEHELKEGQLWRLNRHYVSIISLQDLEVRFRLLDAPNETGERTLTAEADTLRRYLVSRHGKVVPTN